MTHLDPQTLMTHNKETTTGPCIMSHPPGAWWAATLKETPRLQSLDHTSESVYATCLPFGDMRRQGTCLPNLSLTPRHRSLLPNLNRPCPRSPTRPTSLSGGNGGYRIGVSYPSKGIPARGAGLCINPNRLVL